MAKRKTGAQQRYMGPGYPTAVSPQNRGAKQRYMSDEGSSTRNDEDDFQECLRRANEAWSAEYNNLTEGRDCQRFYVGGVAQWDADAYKTRFQKRRPTLTINRLPQFVKQLTGDIRKNPPALKFLPAKGGASQDVAEALGGIARHIEQQSQAKDCYVKAVENAAQAGQGFFRVLTEYSSDDEFDLDIRIRPILDPFGALIDPYATLFDKSDMNYAYVYEQIAVEDFEKEWPDVPIANMPAGVDNIKSYPWRNGNKVRIAEYWRRVPTKKTIYRTPDGKIIDDSELDKFLEEAPELAQTFPQMVKEGVIRSRKVDTFRVETRRVCGAGWLDKKWSPWPGKYIPICMVVGEEITVDGSTSRKGMVHDARDPQRIYNYSRSASVEAVALQPKAPFIGTVDQFKGRPEWATAGSENHAYLAYVPDPKAGNQAPQRAQPALAAAGLDQQAAIASDDMKAVTGIYDAALGAKSNETAGVAIQARQREGDTGTFLYVDNLTRAIGYCGRIMADLIPRVYDTERQVRILREDGTADMVTVNGQPQQTDDGKAPHPFYDLSAGEYDVVVTTGPTFQTQRTEAQENIIQALRAAPQIMQVAPDLVFKMMDWPGADELAERFKKTLPPGLTEDGPMQPPPPNPKDVAATEKDMATAEKTKADTEKTQVETVGLLLQIHAQMAQVQQMLAGGAPMNPGGGPTPAAAPGMVPPPALNPPPPSVNPPAPSMNAPPMVELSELNGVGPV